METGSSMADLPKEDSPNEESPLIVRREDKEDDESGGRRGRVFDSLLDKAGYGFFHVILTLVCGWGLSSDSVEVTAVSFVIPVLQNSSSALNPTSSQAGALDSIIFLGMMFGGYFWGTWADIAGRRVSLIMSLCINGVFGLASALSPNFAAFMFFRFGSGLGVGGSIPVVFSYFAEFFSKRLRGAFIIVLAAFWTVGRLYASLLAWIIIPRDISFYLGSFEVASWRIFIMLCTIPCFSSAIALIFLPESPGYLFSKRKYMKVISFLKRINKCHCKKSQFSSISDAESYLKSLEFESQSVIVKKKTVKENIKLVISTTVEMFKVTYLRVTIVMLVVFFTLSFGYYGLVLWFPEYFHLIEKQNSNTRCNTSCGSVSYNDNKEYLDNVYVSLATIPGLLSGIILINILGAKVLLAISMCISAISTFIIWVVPKTSSNVVILSCIFTGFSTIGFNALSVLVPELYPVHLRSTAFGFETGVGRIGSIIGTVMFGELVSTNPYLPILIVAALLIIGGLAVFLLPATPGKKRVSLSCICRCLLAPLKKFSQKMKYEVLN